MWEKLAPREIGFFDLFIRHTKAGLDAGKALVDALEQWPRGAEGMVRRIEEIEHECDTIAHMTIDLLHRTFITPLDRDETLKLISKMDDVVDGIESAAQRMLLFDIQKVPPRLVDLARVVMKEQEVLVELVPLLHGFKHPDRIRSLIIEVQRLENEADGILRAGLGELFRDHRGDPLLVIQLKELYERIEDASDQAEDVAEIIEGITLEHL
ncbi:MAG TPA: DUF47 family protein [Myxococcota bacterium]|nr:DUF47 family protein [Myxococcota bacterium]HQK50853.1 DUF47 family protein [Myxococcota bacterium]